jgi:hypothetical protein
MQMRRMRRRPPDQVLEGICVDHLVAEVGAEKADFGVVAGCRQRELC